MTTELTTEQLLEFAHHIDNNPLKKLMEGFCRPKQMMTRASNDDDDDDDDDDDYYLNKYALDSAPSQTKHIHEEKKGDSVGLTPVKVGANNNSSKVISKLTTEGSTTEDQINNDDNSNTMRPSPINPGTNDATTTKEESQPGIEASKRVTMMRRKRGIENVIMACIFVLTTLLTLKKLGFTTSDFDFISIVGGGGGDDDNNGDSSSTSKSWIHIFDKKMKIERGKIGVEKSASAKVKLIDKIEEMNDENEDEDDTEGGNDESSYEDDGNNGDEHDYNSEFSPEAKAEL